MCLEVIVRIVIAGGCAGKEVHICSRLAELGVE